MLLETIPEIGYCYYSHGSDRNTLIFKIQVEQKHQRQGWGRLLFYRVLCSAIEHQQQAIVTFCSQKLPVFKFFEHLGFQLTLTETSAAHGLYRCQYEFKLPLLFYCGSGGVSKYDAIAKSVGWRLGVRSCGKWKPQTHMQMVDNHWLKYSHERHLQFVRENKPLIATARDIESPEQLPEILEQAKELAQYAGRILLIPKCKVELPKSSWVGFSVPSSYGGVSPELMPYWLGFPAGKYAGSSELVWYGQHFTHLLGGSPNAQAHYAKHLNVVSLDANYAMNLARHGTACSQGIQIHRAGSCYEAFKLSLYKQKCYWHREWKLSDEPLFANMVI